MGEIELNYFCRLCLKENFSLKNIFSSHIPSGDMLYSVLNYVYDLKICPDDGLPPQICSPCLWKMLEFNSYKKNVHFAGEEILKFLNEKNADSIGDCSSREDDDTYMESDSTQSDPINEEIDIVEWQMPIELKREPMDIEGNGIESVLDTDQNIMNIGFGSVSSKVTLQEIDLELKQEERELIIDKGDAVQSVVSSDLKNCLSFEASEETVGNSFEGESSSICTTLENSVEIRDTNKEINEKELRHGVVPEEESLSAELSKSNLNFTKSELSHSESKRKRRFKSHSESKRKRRFTSYSESSRKRRFTCDNCRKSFIRKRDLGNHVWVHYDERPFSCNICEKSFKNDKVRVRHELIHLKDKMSFRKSKNGSKKLPYSCPKCDKYFSSLKRLQSHSNTHSDKYRCNSCGKTFRDNSNLRSHLTTHTNEKPFKCEVCLKCFSTKSNLNSHLRTHSSDKPFSCDICNKTFKRNSEKIQHALYHMRKE